MTPVRRFVAGRLAAERNHGPIHRVFDKDLGEWVGPIFEHWFDAQQEANRMENLVHLSPEDKVLWDRIEEFLRDYLTDGYHSMIPCIKSQVDNWRYLTSQADRYAAMHESGGGPEAFSEAEGFVMSALVECHEGPHLDTCPDYRNG